MVSKNSQSEGVVQVDDASGGSGATIKVGTFGESWSEPEIEVDDQDAINKLIRATYDIDGAMTRLHLDLPGEERARAMAELGEERFYEEYDEYHDTEKMNTVLVTDGLYVLKYADLVRRGKHEPLTAERVYRLIATLAGWPLVGVTIHLEYDESLIPEETRIIATLDQEKLTDVDQIFFTEVLRSYLNEVMPAYRIDAIGPGQIPPRIIPAHDRVFPLFLGHLGGKSQKTVAIHGRMAAFLFGGKHQGIAGALQRLLDDHEDRWQYTAPEGISEEEQRELEREAERAEIDASIKEALQGIKRRPFRSSPEAFRAAPPEKGGSGFWKQLQEQGQFEAKRRVQDEADAAELRRQKKERERRALEGRTDEDRNEIRRFWDQVNASGLTNPYLRKIVDYLGEHAGDAATKTTCFRKIERALKTAPMEKIRKAREYAEKHARW